MDPLPFLQTYNKVYCKHQHHVRAVGLWPSRKGMGFLSGLTQCGTKTVPHGKVTKFKGNGILEPK